MEAMHPLHGVPMPPLLILTQARIISALNKNNSLSFYPNSIVTPTVLKSVVDPLTVSQRIMVCGSPGISKTMSFLFSYHLSSLHAKFRFENI